LTRLRQHSFDVFAQDNWQKSAKLTLNLGVRYEQARHYVETDGRMTNLDVTPDFSARRR
jgi:outer membrane receptor protein involved in Fe transport